MQVSSQYYNFFFFIILTLAVRPLIFPAPHAIGQALDVGGAQSEVPGVAGEDDPGAVLVVRAVDDPPAAVLQGEGADAGTHHHCRGRRRENNTVNCVLGSELLKKKRFTLRNKMSQKCIQQKYHTRIFRLYKMFTIILFKSSPSFAIKKQRKRSKKNKIQ